MNLSTNYNCILPKPIRIHLTTDMKDPSLEFWTTPPNVFLVAATESGKIVGCISYRLINTDTVEMHRASVHSEFRNLGIAKKLVQALIDTAKEDGYDTMYLETSTAQVNARRLYEKMNFKFLHYMPIDPDFGIVDVLTGIKVAAYTIQLK